MTRGKKIAGVKVHLAVDTGGLPHAVRVTTANVTDRDGAIETLRAYAPNLSKVAKVLRACGYSGENFANAVRLLLEAEVEVVKRNELHTFAVLPKRWIVERTFAWLEKYRRLWKNCERKIHSTHQMMVLAFIAALAEKILNRLWGCFPKIIVLGKALCVFEIQEPVMSEVVLRIDDETSLERTDSLADPYSEKIEKAEIKGSPKKVWTGNAEWLLNPIKMDSFLLLTREEAHAR
jgi:transposase